MPCLPWASSSRPSTLISRSFRSRRRARRIGRSRPLARSSPSNSSVTVRTPRFAPCSSNRWSGRARRDRRRVQPGRGLWRAEPRSVGARRARDGGVGRSGPMRSPCRSRSTAWANRHVAAAGVPVAAQSTLASGREVNGRPAGCVPALPRWEGTAKGIRASSRVADRAALVAEVDRVTRSRRQPALVEAFVPGPEYTVTLIGNAPPEALPVAACTQA